LKSPPVGRSGIREGNMPRWNDLERKGKIHAAKLEDSPRLQRFLAALQTKVPLSTRTLIETADVCNPSTCRKELEENGYIINVERKGEYYFYLLIGEAMKNEC
jgi:hypothetical protein